ncbi:cytochrome P450 monooxygenase-like protein [Periconia macrospinosa]|uniref:Cytochrome P450 monooxygenase-like protein n=1 Tax=Periconia macrospinosa TaxID=97972 RepID=A0A2V1DP38_9PLEO|nr:cytochrome P450 monooxygenase-like protein [Periconia macrospinosa]
MENQSYAVATQTIAFATFMVAILRLLPTLQRALKLAKLPSSGSNPSGENQRAYFLKYTRKLYRDGYRKLKNSAFRMVASDEIDYVVVSPRFLRELKSLPDDVLSVNKGVEKLLESHYTSQRIDLPVMIKTIKTDLTPALGRLNDGISEEIDISLERFLPSSEDCTSVVVYKMVAEIVAQVSGRVFVGPELCRNPEYIEHSINFTRELMDAANAIKRMSPWMRPFRAGRLPELQRLRSRRERVSEFLRPIIQERNQAGSKPDDMMQWVMGRDTSADFDTLVSGHLLLTFGAIHTTTAMVTNAMFTLAVAKEYISPLREEIRSVLASNDGRLTPRALQQMVKLDSFMKEVNRWYPHTVVTFRRYVQKPITLSNGQYIPAGVIIEAPSDAINFDPDIHTDPHTFDGSRFYKRGQSADPGKISRSQFVATNEEDVSFGLGRHACPGRFFAANEIKIILARLILDYDVAMPEGLTERYSNIEFEKNMVPDATKMLIFKRVQGEKL